VLARVYDPIRAQAYREVGIETVCTTMVGAGMFHDMLLGRSLRTLQEYTDDATPQVGPQ